MNDVRSRVAEAARRDAPRALATLARVLGDLGEAEDAVQEALTSALGTWPERGVPDDIAAWLTTVGRNRAFDRRRREARRPVLERIAAAGDPAATDGADLGGDPGGDLGGDLVPVPDDQLRMLFTCVHPAIGPDAQLTLMLRLVAGLSLEQVARSCAVTVDTAEQRLVRAKRKIRTAAVPFRLPADAQLGDRLPRVLVAVEQLFTRGYAPVSGERTVDLPLCEEALRLARLVAEQWPDEPEPRALLALLGFQHSRRDARQDVNGHLVPLAAQDRGRWDRPAIAAATEDLARAAALRRAATPPLPGERGPAGPFELHARAAAEHANAATWEATRWDRIVAAYDALGIDRPSPALALARAVAISHRDGPAAALPLVAAVEAAGPPAGTTHRVAAVRGDLLERLGDRGAARRAFTEAATQAPDGPERDHLRRRAEQLHPPGRGVEGRSDALAGLATAHGAEDDPGEHERGGDGEQPQQALDHEADAADHQAGDDEDDDEGHGTLQG